jgi:hypothetical protein
MADKGFDSRSMPVSFRSSRTAQLGTHLTTCAVGARVKCLEPEGGHSYPSSVEMKSKRNLTCFPHTSSHNCGLLCCKIERVDTWLIVWTGGIVAKLAQCVCCLMLQVTDRR